MKKSLFVKTAVALALTAPLLASAESQLVTGADSATARLDLRVVIPRVLFLGVGAGAATPLASNGGINTLTFDYSANPQDIGTTLAAASISNDGPLPSGNAIPVRVFGNDGQITITATNETNLVSGSDTIPFTQLSVTTTNAALPAPAFGGTSLPTLNGKVTNQTANWAYSYANATTPAFGTYTGRVTYTATMP
ncbi:hypothetical protein [Hydrogenophaga sp.]|uniref:hypothetical protein n=1 Tax=Hydrogenophaga sp. TaxID=1904254 RepID=UPI0027206656|nr:hypothetical protein [Hydrogenophaga sp.]MDO9149530.1 hypothetical protein [Hydrogenophaga sp.]MDP2407183.1 hypothetical protein [Hydrogenophaga sp.]MDP3326207.1 hypothetical protein [Hydrogenophaga sp.]MDP3884862.1 hypothetical protein [Hydrogenophaga sp.]MDZ4175134.1 hypothetical protein [Hydrogenophaga sp.]